MEHSLKCWPEYFSEIKAGRKTAEVRFNDRDFQVGDYLRMEEYLPAEDVYTGNQILCEVTHILTQPKGCRYELLGHQVVAMSIKLCRYEGEE